VLVLPEKDVKVLFTLLRHEVIVRADNARQPESAAMIAGWPVVEKGVMTISGEQLAELA
jgi:hypothetical protein